MVGGVDITRIERQPKGQHNPDKNFLQKTGTKIALATGAGVLAVAGVGARLGLFEPRGSSPETTVATVPAAVVPDKGPQFSTPIPTEVATTTATPEAKQEAPCLVIPQEFCSQAERVMVKGIRAEFTYLGFKNLPAGTPIFSPLDGFFTVGNESGPQFVGSNIGISIPNVKEAKGGIIIRGIIRIDNTTQRDIRSGEIIGYKKDGKTLDGKYDLLFTITKATASGAETDEDILRNLAPDAFRRPVAGNIQSVDKPGSTVVFSLPPNEQPDQ